MSGPRGREPDLSARDDPRLLRSPRRLYLVTLIDATKQSPMHGHPNPILAHYFNFPSASAASFFAPGCLSLSLTAAVKSVLASAALPRARWARPRL